MDTETSNTSHVLTRLEADLDIEQPHHLNPSGVSLKMTSDGAEVINQMLIPAPNDIPSSVSPVADPKPRRRRRNNSSRKDDEGSLADSQESPLDAVLKPVQSANGNPANGCDVLADFGNSEADEEATLAKRIGKLWTSDRNTNSKIRRSRQELTILRTNLSRDLYRYKTLLVRSGRDGKWSAFLREVNIPRASADRLAQKWERSMKPTPTNCLTGAIPVPTPEEITRMATKLKLKLSRVLTTSESVAQFLSALTAALREPIPN
jgi:hypothetical protein